MRAFLVIAALCAAVDARCARNDGFKCVEYRKSSVSVAEFGDYRLTVKANATRKGGVAYSWMLFTPYPALRLQFLSEILGVADGVPVPSKEYKMRLLVDF